MGNPLKRRAVREMLQRWKRDEKRLANLFGEDNPEFSDEAKIQRNLGSAIAYAAGLLNRLSPQDMT